MTVVVAMVAGAVWTVIVVLLVTHYHQRQMRPLVRQLRQNFDERQELLNRIMYMAQKPWTLPEAEAEFSGVPWPQEEDVVWPELEAEV